MFNFRFGTDKMVRMKFGLPQTDGPNFIRTSFIRTVPKIARSVNGPQMLLRERQVNKRP